MKDGLSRRQALQAVGALALTAYSSRGFSFAPSDRVRFASIGVGGRGDAVTGDAARLGDIVAICDVDANALANSQQKYPDARAYRDFRRMLEEHHREFDAVLVNTPDHTHAVAAAMAMRLGKAVYCEKPLTRTLGESRVLSELARRTGVATQLGNQFVANTSLRRAAAAIRAGFFGNVKEIYLWTDRALAYWPQGIERNPPEPVPDHLDWDLWLGPAPARPYSRGYHGFAWRGWWDFGTGALGDMGCHLFNLPYMALHLDNPVAVEARTSGHNRDSFPLWSEVTFDFAPRLDRPALRLFWYDGGRKPNPDLAPGVEFGGNGMLLVADRATLYSDNAYGAGLRRLDGEPMPEVYFDASPGHMEDFVQAIQTGRPARANFSDFGGPLTETVLLGNLAIWSGARVEWDAASLRARGASSDAESLIHSEYRAGWTL